ncbi:MAG: tRNA 2-thiouridine(34) synthase MnmA [Ruminococcaceae bacterium]|nr:tRNA 2-thiouridine(34) synthase MnmA [Oscillospiraceae bacterium]
MKKKVLAAMSGGVDSSVCAWELVSKGIFCEGAMMRLCDAAFTGKEQSTEDAQAVCHRLGIPFHNFDAVDCFRDQVVSSFVEDYEMGLTPNPCVICNQTIKFGLFLEKALSMGFTHIATGHYARIREENGRYLLYKASDESKDQSYFLAGLTQHQLAHTLFPLGDMSKEDVRRIAAEQGFLNANKKDSQDICFIPDGDHTAFIHRYTKKHYPTGNFLDLQGNIVGTHSGAVGYTLGQRKGLGLAMGEPVYVCAKDMQANTVTVGPNEALFSTSLLANNWNWIAFESLDAPLQCTAKARSRHVAQSATVYPEEGGICQVVFDAPQRALTPGQSIVLYRDDLVIGAGTILSI